MLRSFLLTTAAVAVAVLLVPGIRLHDTETSQMILTLALVSVVLGLLNALIKPILTTITACLVMITFGLFLWVINAAMMMLASWVCAQAGIGWSVDGWFSAFVGALIIALVSALAGGILPNRRDRK